MGYYLIDYYGQQFFFNDTARNSEYFGDKGKSVGSEPGFRTAAIHRRFPQVTSVTPSGGTPEGPASL